MKSKLLLALVGLAFVASPALADTPSIRKAKDRDTKEFVTKVGEAIVKAARSAPKSIELVKYDYTKPKDGRRVLTIKMTYKGLISKKKFTSTIKMKIDSSEKEWEVLNIDYSDDNKVSLANPNTTKIQKLIKDFNK